MRPMTPTMPIGSGACCWRASEVFAHFRTGFLGKTSPVHFFWGSFDLAVTRFSGRRAPRHPGGVPHLPNAVAQEAYSHEVSSAGFWPGGGGPIDYAAFYSYAYPAPDGFRRAKVKPADAFFSKELGEFLLPYDAVRTARDPGCGAHGIPAKHLRCGGRSGEMGSHGARVRVWSAKPAAAGLSGAVSTAARPPVLHTPPSAMPGRCGCARCPGCRVQARTWPCCRRSPFRR